MEAIPFYSLFKIMFMKYIRDVNICQEVFDDEFLSSFFYSFMTKISGPRQRKEHWCYFHFLMTEKYFRLSYLHVINTLKLLLRKNNANLRIEG